jgi:hypothetical protein
MVYKWTLFGVGGFPFLLCLLILKDGKASYNFETTSIHDFSEFLNRKLNGFPFYSRFHILVSIVTVA